MLQKVPAIFVNGPLSKKFWVEVHIRSAFDQPIIFELDLEMKVDDTIPENFRGCVSFFISYLPHTFS